MSEPIDFIKNNDWMKNLAVEGYKSPIDLYIKKVAQEITTRRENEIVAQITEYTGLDIDKNELVRALAYDRDQYNKGFRAGYERALFDISCQLGQAVGILTDILNQVRGEVGGEPDETN